MRPFWHFCRAALLAYAAFLMTVLNNLDFSFLVTFWMPEEFQREAARQHHLARHFDFSPLPILTVITLLLSLGFILSGCAKIASSNPKKLWS